CHQGLPGSVGPLVRVEAFGLNRSEYKTLRRYAGDAVTFPRILGIELVGVVDSAHGDAGAVPPGARHHAVVGGSRRAARDVPDGGRVAPTLGRGDAALARRDVLGRPRVLELAPRGWRARDRDDPPSGAKGRRLTELGAAGAVLDGDGFVERARTAR